MTFADLGLSAALTKAVKHEGYLEPTPIQAQAIPLILAGNDVLGCAQTGTGKTAAYALPLLHHVSTTGRQPRGQRKKTRALVLAPTRELTQQIATMFRTYGKLTELGVLEVYGGVATGPQISALKQGVEVVVATPGRLLDLVRQRAIELKWVEFFVLDEADRMLDMGFVPDVREIAAELPTRRQTLLFSATLPHAIIDLASDLLSEPIEIEVAPEKVTADQIDQSVYFVAQRNKPVLLAHLLKNQAMTRVLVFCKTKHRANICVRHLHRAGVRAEAIHGNKSQTMRQLALQHFKSGKATALVATDVAARGLDVDDVTHVVNYDLPFDAETYVHRIGRTARAGASGVAISFCDERERDMLQQVERLIRNPIVIKDDHPEYPVLAVEPDPDEDDEPGDGLPQPQPAADTPPLPSRPRSHRRSRRGRG